jgi:hypothetical protein
MLRGLREKSESGESPFHWNPLLVPANIAWNPGGVDPTSRALEPTVSSSGKLH